ncbi:hypothetical protein FNFX1_1656 [Francisella cf. novicida Fx1]|nr:hypothetical protein FNFX1_1656 [Francisella cf. novicida Fx1]EDX18908.1 conserved hypothetical protein [Francisella tularensis subsp. novicida FTE]
MEEKTIYRGINVTIVTKHLVQIERPIKLLEILFYKYVFKHQTYADLALEYGKTKR